MMAKRIGRAGIPKTEAVLSDAGLFTELSHLIEQSRQQVAAYANSALTVLFWQIGKRINEEVLQNQRAEYGKQIVVTLSRQLEEEHGRNFTEKNVRRMMRFATEFPDFEIVPLLAAQLEVFRAWCSYGKRTDEFIQFAGVLPTHEIVVPLARQSSPTIYLRAFPFITLHINCLSA